jgi:hypothetical protein
LGTRSTWANSWVLAKNPHLAKDVSKVTLVKHPKILIWPRMTLVKNPHLANEIPANPHLSRMTLVMPTSPEVTLIWPKAPGTAGGNCYFQEKLLLPPIRDQKTLWTVFNK